jgi:threonine/homoserine/homoserine lactone efflux protein
VDSVGGIAITSFLVGLSGAVMPGPVLTITIGETAARLRTGSRKGDSLSAAPTDSTVQGGGSDRRGRARGALVGPLIVLGHGLLEILLVAGLVLGLGRLLVLGPVIGTIGLVGGGVLVWMAWGMFKSLKGLTLRSLSAVSGRRQHPVLAGILTTLSNPYWIIWWATIGLGYIALSMRMGFVGLASFYLGHILSDLAWYGSVSLSLAMGHRLLTDRVYRGLVAVCACFLLAFGLYFGYAGVRYLLA